MILGHFLPVPANVTQYSKTIACGKLYILESKTVLTVLRRKRSVCVLTEAVGLHTPDHEAATVSHSQRAIARHHTPNAV